jgi:hypothetical protein
MFKYYLEGNDRLCGLVVRVGFGSVVVRAVCYKLWVGNPMR